MECHAHVIAIDSTSEMIRTERALLRWDQGDLADASSASLPMIKRLKSKPEPQLSITFTEM
jgi:hypothetical protein